MTEEQTQKIQNILNCSLDEIQSMNGYDFFKKISRLLVDGEIDKKQHAWLIKYHRQHNPVQSQVEMYDGQEKESIEDVVRSYFDEELPTPKDLKKFKKGSVAANLLDLLSGINKFMIKGRIIKMYRANYPTYRYAETIGRQLRSLTEGGYLLSRLIKGKVYYKIT